MPQHIVGALFPLGFGLVASTWSGWNLVLALRSLEWPRVLGEVLTCELRLRHDEGTDFLSPAVTYKYKVGVQELVAKRIFFGDRFQNEWFGLARRVASNYPPGRSVEIRYHPANPRLAVLEPGVNPQLWICLAVSLILLAIGVGALL